jgi:hypothetical protein
MSRVDFTEKPFRQISPAAFFARQIGQACAAARRDVGGDARLCRNKRLFRARRFFRKDDR